MKISLAAENERTVFQKLREAALAYHLTRKWSKERILRNYLNSIYFGNGAYGIESAARTYFQYNHDELRRAARTPTCASVLLPHEAALLAGDGRLAERVRPDPAPRRRQASRRDLVLLRMFEQGYLTRSIYDEREGRRPSRRRDDLTFPREDTEYPYFTSWIKQQVVDRLGGGQQGAQLAFEGGLQVKTTIDSGCRTPPRRRSTRGCRQAPRGPRASLVAISNKDGDGPGDGRRRQLRRRAVQPRHPGPAPARLGVQAVRARRGARAGHQPAVHLGVEEADLHPQGRRALHGQQLRRRLRRRAHARAARRRYSDNAVYVQVGKQVGTKKVAKLARRMGIRTPVSTNLAIALGGLRQGVTPLDMAHAYETFADRRQADLRHALARPERQAPARARARSGSSASTSCAAARPRRSSSTTARKLVNKREKRTVLKPDDRRRGRRRSCRPSSRRAPATRAQIPGVMIAGKTGTTEDYGDAWFVGWTKEYTVAVWVGYPDEFKPMKTEFQGEPVAGGTFPAAIWKTFMESLLKIDPLPKKDGGDGTGTAPTPTPRRRHRRAAGRDGRAAAADDARRRHRRRDGRTGGGRRRAGRRRRRHDPPPPTPSAGRRRPPPARTPAPATTPEAAARRDAGRRRRAGDRHAG